MPARSSTLRCLSTQRAYPDRRRKRYTQIRVRQQITCRVPALIDVLPAPVPTGSKQDNDSVSNTLPSILAPLFRWRHQPHFGRLEAVILGLYVSVLAIVLPAHEPWSDEAQAWLLAQDNSTWELIRHRLHYEGAPALWHLLIKAFQHLHGTFHSFGWFAAAFSILGVYVLLRWSPFPPIVRILLPFTYFLQYQYAVVARSYVLFPLLAFALCALFGRRRQIILFSLLAGLFANLCMQGIEFATALCALYAFELWREHRNGFPLARRRVLTSATVFACMAALACYSAIPAPDVNFAVSESVSNGSAHDLLVRVVGETKPFFTKPPLPGPHLPRLPDDPQPGFFPSPALWAAWQYNHQPPSPGKSIEEFAVSMATQATWSLSTSNLLASTFLVAAFVWFRKRGGARMLLPWFMLLPIGEVIWVSDHHLGMVFTALIAGIWLAWRAKPYAQMPHVVETVFTCAFVLVLAAQVTWTISASCKEVKGNYDPGKQTAEFLKSSPVRRTAAFNYWSESIQPYFDENPFYNVPTKYRIWSFKTNPDPYYQEALEEHPDRIVYSVEFPGPGTMRNQWMPLTHIPSAEERRTLPWDQAIEYFHRSGYVETHRFCGQRFGRLSYSYMDCDLIFELIARDGSSLARAEYPHAK